MQDYFWKKEPALVKLLSRYPDETAFLEMKAEKFDKHTAYQVEFILTLPHNRLYSKEASHAITKAVDLSKDRLVEQIKKNSEMARRSHRGIKVRRTLKRQEHLLVS